MDIFSHGLWGSVTVGRKNKKSFWTAFAFGVFPDLFAFGLPFSHLLFSMLTGDVQGVMVEHGAGHPNIPEYTYGLYNISHSLVIFAAVFLLVWAVRKKPLWETLAWGLHIALDIFTHNDKFFPTPFLWPISDFYVNGISWGQPIIFFPNVALLVGFYAYWWYRRHKNPVS
ncbi:MAG: hypothetical protein A3C93_03265 [Candidatus Lloydbacteria bacterium RIFCSPHIGHO2_02_FULL_54_17]|uniref:Uncharacterized protein n=1 Tax=Candidatus Lloydbacteria bacterium RIFCSPHIGHO2_02_FULL_54_17 TaxID=1798664 RepID=A0A1G2DH07_9BACT|nr:MAG: hypothetical protein A3C93_03265 [Candidatus Lloydbacteria bacterium RIFCSPHIGHO2_02_FULL_54_17]OGZ14873.1 MAG: hypothetical protein A2948_02310 [Candidatus Lloydbacteria bacterium RIFCSPLOWO2_01_FULL_54_18]OGZ16875.1 MAG: hypothetical protein A3H76_01115 [Candidatus Lloydbacteria bacterium RIFCSPLOWO2_02_FULL_54_12]